MNISFAPNYTSLAEALVSLYGSSVAIAETDRLHGGDINKAYGLTLNNGKKIFMKANAKQNAVFLQPKQQGLLLLQKRAQLVLQT